MHLPDGFLSLPVTSATAVIAIASVAASIKKLRKKMTERIVPYMAVLAAFIFAAQMFNFPIAGGTSGHLIGGMLAAVILGPAASILILACVLIVQCLVFQDGGLLALGANITNMAVIGVAAGYSLYYVLRKTNERLAIFLGSWISVVAASVGCSLELIFSNVASAKAIIIAMVGIHALIGIGEGIITVLVVEFIKKSGKLKVAA